MLNSIATQAADAVCVQCAAGLLVQNLCSWKGLVQNCERNFRGQEKVLALNMWSPPSCSLLCNNSSLLLCVIIPSEDIFSMNFFKTFIIYQPVVTCQWLVSLLGAIPEQHGQDQQLAQSIFSPLFNRPISLASLRVFLNVMIPQEASAAGPCKL